MDDDTPKCPDCGSRLRIGTADLIFKFLYCPECDEVEDAN